MSHDEDRPSTAGPELLPVVARYLSEPYPFIIPKTPFLGTGVVEKNDARAKMRGVGPPNPRFQCCGFGTKWRVFRRSRKMTFFVNRLGAQNHNIEIEGTGVDMRWLSQKWPGVIFFDNTGVRFVLFSIKTTMPTWHAGVGRRSLSCKFWTSFISTAPASHSCCLLYAGVACLA